MDRSKELKELWEQFEEWSERLFGPRHFILDENRQIVPCKSVLEAAEWFNTADRQVALAKLSGNVVVSTVFIGLNHNYGAGPPLLFETAIDRGEGYSPIMRYETWADAEHGHQMIVEDLMKHEGREIEEEGLLEAEILE